MTNPLRRALATAAAALFALPLLAADPWDGPPLSADPQALLDAARNVAAGDADVVMLFNEGTYSVDGDGRIRTRLRMLYRVVTAKGVRRIDTTSLHWQPWYEEKPEIRARVIGADGSVHALDPAAVADASAEYSRNIFSDERVLHAPLPGVAADAVVEILFERVAKSVIPGAGKSSWFTFAGPVPHEHSRLTLEGPAGFAPHIVNKSGIEPRIVEKDGRKQFIFERGRAEADVVDESYLPSDELLYPYVAFSTGTSWNELARGYAAIVDRQIAGADVRAAAAAAVRGAAGREEIAERLVEYVQANVHYAGIEIADGSIVPRDPGGVLKNKYGDCKDKATLLVALLRAAGVPAHVALLNAGYGFDVSNELPSMNRFNHAIVVAGGGTPLWIDPTDEFARAGMLPDEDQGRMALIADAATTSLTRTPELPSTAVRRIETRTFTMPEEGRARVVETTTGTGPIEASLRRERAESDADKYKESLQKYATSYYIARALETFSTTDPHDLSKPFALTLDMAESKSGIVVSGDAAVAISPHALVGALPRELADWVEPKPNAPSLDKKRRHDFVLHRAFVKEWRYRVVLPPGYRARTLPRNETKQLGTMTLTNEFAAEDGGVVTATFRFDTGKRRMTAAEFAETRIAVSKLLAEPQSTIGFESIGQAKLNAGDVRGALEEFRRVAALHPKEAQHHVEIARALIAGGLGEAAREEARRAVAIEPASARAHYMLALVLENDLLGRALRTGFDLDGAIAALRKAKQLDGTKLQFRIQLAELLSYGQDGLRYGRGNHLSEAIDEYKSLLAEFGAEARGYEPQLMAFYAFAGRWDEMKTFLDTMPDGEQKSKGRILAAAATSGIDAAMRELDGFGGDERRGYAGAVAQTLLQLRRYPEAAAMLEASAQGAANATEIQPLLAVVKKARRSAAADDSAAAAIRNLFRAAITHDMEQVRKYLSPDTNITTDDFPNGKMFGGELPPQVMADLFDAFTDSQTEGNDDLGYRVRLHIGAGAGSSLLLTAFVSHKDNRWTIRAVADKPASVGAAAMELAAAGKLDAARTWLNWERETIAAGGGDDPLAGSPFAPLWPKDKASATREEIDVAAAALAATVENERPEKSEIEARKKAAALLLAARKSAPDERRKWIDVALASALDDPAQIAELAAPLAASHPDSGTAFVAWTRALARSGRLAEAVAVAKQRLERSPRDREALTMLCEFAARRSDYAAATVYVKRIIDELTPTERDYNEVAWLALFTGKDIDKAVEQAQQASTSASLHTLASLYAEAGKSVEARQALFKAMDKRLSDTPTSIDWYVVGRIAENYGVPDAAAAAYKRVEKDPSSSMAIDSVSTWALAQRRLAAMK